MLKRITLTKNKKDKYNLSILHDTGKGLSMSEKIKDIELANISNVIIDILRDEQFKAINKKDKINGNN